jgi:iron complex transport system substrate-binding protein
MAASDIKNIMAILGAGVQDEYLSDRLQERVNIILHKLKFISEKPRVACIVGLSPLVIGSKQTPLLIDIAGGIPLHAAQGENLPASDAEALMQADPDILIVMPSGFTLGQTLQEIHVLPELPGWADLNAVKNNRVYIANGDQYFCHSGSGLVDGLEILAEIINPKQFVFGYEGEGWIKFNV